MNENSSPPAKINQRIRPKFNWRILTLLGGIVLFFSLGLGAGYILWGYPLADAQSELASVQTELNQIKNTAQAGADESSQPAASNEPAADGEIQQVTRYPVSEDDDPVYGPEDAPITIIEFSDYECPYCQRWHEQVWIELREAYPDQIRLVYRDFPLYSIHPNAEPAANAANCANEQDQFWEFHELLFTGGRDLGEDTYLKYAADLGLDMNDFQQCIDENRYEAEITADYEYALSIGIQSTPTFFVNGIALIGAQPIEVFQEVIELELAGKFSN